MNVIDYKPRAKKIKPKTTLRVEAEKVIKALVITLSLMIVALGVVFLITNSENAQKGYTLDQTKRKNEQLKQENSNLITKITNSTSFSNLEENEKLKEMEATESKNYVTPEDNAIN